MRLEDFNTPNVEGDIEEFIPKSRSTPSTTPYSNLNLALGTLSASDNKQETSDTIAQGLNELNEIGSSEILKSKNAELNEEIKQKSGGALEGILLDQDIADEQKLLAIDNYKASKKVTTPEMVLSKNIAESYEEDAEAELMAELRADTVNPSWEYERQLQEAQNDVAKTFDSSTGTALLDLTELVVISPSFNQHTHNLLKGLRAMSNGEDTGIGEFLLEGTAIKEMRTIIKSVPIEKRGEFSGAILKMFDQESGIYLKDENDFATYDTIRRVFEGEYTDTDEFIDNAVGALSLIPLVGAVMKGVRGAQKVSDIRKAYVGGRTASSSVGSLTLKSNKQKGLDMAEEAMKDDNAAKALFGSTKEDVAVEVFGPKPATDVVNAIPSGNSRIINYKDQTGHGELTDTELSSAVSGISNKFKDALGLTYRSELSQVAHEDGVVVKAVYTAGENGWSSAKEAKEQVLFSLRGMGVADDEVTILTRTEKGYEDLGLSDEVGEYVARVEYKAQVQPNDVTQWSELNVKNNIFDRVPFFSGDNGSVQRHLLDPMSMLDPRITGSATNAVDKGNLIGGELQKLGDVFSKSFKKLNKKDQRVLGKYLEEANDKGVSHTADELFQKGYNQAQIKAVKEYREFWDTAYWLENADAATTLRTGNFKQVVAGDSKFYAKREPMNFSNNRALDPETGQLTKLNDEQIRELYKQGHISLLRTPTKIGDEIVERVIVRENKTNYSRVIRDEDQVLNYRKGYTTKRYDAPVFVDRILRDAKGNKVGTETVGVARDHVEGNLIRSRLAKKEGVDAKSYGIVRENKDGNHISGEQSFDLEQARGRTSQRLRGKPLTEVTQPMVNGLDGSLVEDPIDAMTKSARSIGDRVAMRDWLSASKGRFMEQYGEFVQTVNGQKVFPRSVKDLDTKGAQTTKKAADARTTLEYINYMQNGYINGLDESIKGLLRTVGHNLGRAGWGKTQRVLNTAADVGLTGSAKGSAFQLYIALNPVRQWLIQSHQAIRLNAINPKYMVGGKFATDLAQVQAGRLTGKSNELFDFVMDSGQIQGITRSNLLQDSLQEMTNQSLSSKAGKLARPMVNLSRASTKVGFEFGESNNIITSILSFRNQALRQGKDLSKRREREAVYAAARNFTYNMNKAGDMPYNQNSLSMLMQFLQVPHKAITQDLLNQGLTSGQKASALMFDTAMFGLPAYFLMEKFLPEGLPTDPEVRKKVQYGLEGFIFNEALNAVTKEESSIDFSTLAPFDAHGFGNILQLLSQEGIAPAMERTPSGQLFFGPNPRVTNFLKDAYLLTGRLAVDPNEKDFLTMAESFAKLSSGMSNGFKAKFAIETGKIASSSGQTLQEGLTTTESLALAFGLTTEEIRSHYKITNQMYVKSKAFKDDVTEQYRTLKRQLLLTDGSIDQLKLINKMMAHAHTVWGDSSIAASTMMYELMRKDAAAGDATVYNRLLKMSGYVGGEELKTMVQDYPMAEESKKNLINSIDFVNKSKEDK